jgi:mono/diheme cytochrome c family protein
MLLVLALVQAVLAAQPHLPPSPDGDIAKGRVFAADRCGLCHATGPKGASPVRKAPAFRDLHKRYDIDGLAEALAEGIGVGDARMPAHVLKPEEIDNLLAYIKSLSPRDR